MVNVKTHVGFLVKTWITAWILLTLGPIYGQSQNGHDAPGQCPGEDKSSLQNGFQFSTLGNTTTFEKCVNLCCGDGGCEIALLSGARCFGVACNQPNLCHKIVDQLLRTQDQHEQQDIIKHSVLASSPLCPRPFATSFSILVPGSIEERKYARLHDGPISTDDCTHLCCKSRDCLLSFLEDEACYSVHRADDITGHVGPRLSLQVAIIDRKREVARSVDDGDDNGDDDDDDDLGSEEEDNKRRLNHNPKTLHDSPSLNTSRGKHNGSNETSKKSSTDVRNTKTLLTNNKTKLNEAVVSSRETNKAAVKEWPRRDRHDNITNHPETETTSNPHHPVPQRSKTDHHQTVLDKPLNFTVEATRGHRKNVNKGLTEPSPVAFVVSPERESRNVTDKPGIVLKGKPKNDQSDANRTINIKVHLKDMGHSTDSRDLNKSEKSADKVSVVERSGVSLPRNHSTHSRSSTASQSNLKEYATNASQPAGHENVDKHNDTQTQERSKYDEIERGSGGDVGGQGRKSRDYVPSSTGHSLETETEKDRSTYDAQNRRKTLLTKNAYSRNRTLTDSRGSNTSMPSLSGHADSVHKKDSFTKKVTIKHLQLELLNKTKPNIPIPHGQNTKLSSKVEQAPLRHSGHLAVNETTSTSAEEKDLHDLKRLQRRHPNTVFSHGQTTDVNDYDSKHTREREESSNAKLPYKSKETSKTKTNDTELEMDEVDDDDIGDDDYDGDVTKHAQALTASRPKDETQSQHPEKEGGGKMKQDDKKLDGLEVTEEYDNNIGDDNENERKHQSLTAKPTAQTQGDGMNGRKKPTPDVKSERVEVVEDSGDDESIDKAKSFTMSNSNVKTQHERGEEETKQHSDVKSEMVEIVEENGDDENNHKAKSFAMSNMSVTTQTERGGKESKQHSNVKSERVEVVDDNADSSGDDEHIDENIAGPALASNVKVKAQTSPDKKKPRKITKHIHLKPQSVKVPEERSDDDENIGDYNYDNKHKTFISEKSKVKIQTQHHHKKGKTKIRPERIEVTEGHDEDDIGEDDKEEVGSSLTSVVQSKPQYQHKEKGSKEKHVKKEVNKNNGSKNKTARADVITSVIKRKKNKHGVNHGVREKVSEPTENSKEHIRKKVQELFEIDSGTTPPPPQSDNEVRYHNPRADVKKEDEEDSDNGSADTDAQSKHPTSKTKSVANSKRNNSSKTHKSTSPLSQVHVIDGAHIKLEASHFNKKVADTKHYTVGDTPVRVKKRKGYAHGAVKSYTKHSSSVREKHLSKAQELPSKITHKTREPPLQPNGSLYHKRKGSKDQHDSPVAITKQEKQYNGDDSDQNGSKHDSDNAQKQNFSSEHKSRRPMKKAAKENQEISSDDGSDLMANSHTRKSTNTRVPNISSTAKISARQRKRKYAHAHTRLRKNTAEGRILLRYSTDNIPPLRTLTTLAKQRLNKAELAKSHGRTKKVVLTREPHVSLQDASHRVGSLGNDADTLQFASDGSGESGSGTDETIDMMDLTLRRTAIHTSGMKYNKKGTHVPLKASKRIISAGNHDGSHIDDSVEPKSLTKRREFAKHIHKTTRPAYQAPPDISASHSALYSREGKNNNDYGSAERMITSLESIAGSAPEQGEDDDDDLMNSSGQMHARNTVQHRKHSTHKIPDDKRHEDVGANRPVKPVVSSGKSERKLTHKNRAAIKSLSKRNRARKHKSQHRAKSKIAMPKKKTVHSKGLGSAIAISGSKKQVALEKYISKTKSYFKKNTQKKIFKSRTSKATNVHQKRTKKLKIRPKVKHAHVNHDKISKVQQVTSVTQKSLDQAKRKHKALGNQMPSIKKKKSRHKLSTKTTKTRKGAPERTKKKHERKLAKGKMGQARKKVQVGKHQDGVKVKQGIIRAKHKKNALLNLAHDDKVMPKLKSKQDLMHFSQTIPEVQMNLKTLADSTEELLELPSSGEEVRGSGASGSGKGGYDQLMIYAHAKKQGNKSNGRMRSASSKHHQRKRSKKEKTKPIIVSRYHFAKRKHDRINTAHIKSIKRLLRKPNLASRKPKKVKSNFKFAPKPVSPKSVIQTVTAVPKPALTKIHNTKHTKTVKKQKHVMKSHFFSVKDDDSTGFSVKDAEPNVVVSKPKKQASNTSGVEHTIATTSSSPKPLKTKQFPKDSFRGHFYKGKSSNGIQFSAVHGHKKKPHSDHSMDVDDLGDADFDIQMSNDIPHKKPKTVKPVTKHHKEEYVAIGEDSDSDTKPKLIKKRKKIHPHKQENDDDDDNDDDKNWFKGHVKYIKKIGKDDERRRGRGDTPVPRVVPKKHHPHHHHEQSDDDDENEEQKKTLRHHEETSETSGSTYDEEEESGPNHDIVSHTKRPSHEEEDEDDQESNKHSEVRHKQVVHTKKQEEEESEDEKDDENHTIKPPLDRVKVHHHPRHETKWENNETNGNDNEEVDHKRVYHHQHHHNRHHWPHHWPEEPNDRYPDNHERERKLERKHYIPHRPEQLKWKHRGIVGEDLEIQHGDERGKDKDEGSHHNDKKLYKDEEDDKERKRKLWLRHKHRLWLKHKEREEEAEWKAHQKEKERYVHHKYLAEVKKFKEQEKPPWIKNEHEKEEEEQENVEWHKPEHHEDNGWKVHHEKHHENLEHDNSYSDLHQERHENLEHDKSFSDHHQERHENLEHDKSYSDHHQEKHDHAWHDGDGKPWSDEHQENYWKDGDKAQWGKEHRDDHASWEKDKNPWENHRDAWNDKHQRQNGDNESRLSWHRKPWEQHQRPSEQKLKSSEEPKPWGEQPKPWNEEPKPWGEKPKPWEEQPKPWEEKAKLRNEEPKPWNEEPTPWEEKPKPWESVSEKQQSGRRRLWETGQEKPPWSLHHPSIGSTRQHVTSSGQAWFDDENRPSPTTSIQHTPWVRGNDVSPRVWPTNPQEKLNWTKNQNWGETSTTPTPKVTQIYSSNLFHTTRPSSWTPSQIKKQIVPPTNSWRNPNQWPLNNLLGMFGGKPGPGPNVGRSEIPRVPFVNPMVQLRNLLLNITSTYQPHPTTRQTPSANQHVLVNPGPTTQNKGSVNQSTLAGANMNGVSPTTRKSSNTTTSHTNATQTNIQDTTAPTKGLSTPGARNNSGAPTKKSSVNGSGGNQTTTAQVPTTRSNENTTSNSKLNGFFSQETHTTQKVTQNVTTISQIPSSTPNGQPNTTDNHTTEGHTTTPTSISTTHQITNSTTKTTAEKPSITHKDDIPVPMTHKGNTPIPAAEKPKKDDIPIPPPAMPTGSDDIIGESGGKQRKHGGPTCQASETTNDMTLMRGKRAGNFTNVGDVGDFEMCIKRCCQAEMCNLAYKSGESCYLVHCYTKESCEITPALIQQYSPQMSFIRRFVKEREEGNKNDKENDDDNNDGDEDRDSDKKSPSGIREICDAEPALGISWKQTSAGHYSTVTCPRQAKGKAKRKCEADSRWQMPDFSDCVTSEYLKLYEKARKLAETADSSPLIRDLSQLTTQTIDNSLIFGGDLVKSLEIMSAVVQHNGQNDLMEMSRDDMKNFMTASSNLLDLTNQQEWLNVQKDNPGSADVLRSMEMFALQAAIRLPREEMQTVFMTNNIVVKLDRRNPRDGGLVFPDFSDEKIISWDARHDFISIPPAVFERGEISTASISFKTLPYLLPDANASSGLGPNSKVLSTILHPAPSGKISPPVTIVLSHIKPKRANPTCVFWDYSINPRKGGGWSTRGCWLASSNTTHSVCQCEHLSNFAVLMNLSDDEVSAKEQKRERTMALMWIGIPVLIVGVIGALYMSFSWTGKSRISNSMNRSIDEKTGLLGHRVTTSRIREEFPASPKRDLYRALSPAYSPQYSPLHHTKDLEWQDEFHFNMASIPGQDKLTRMVLPQLEGLRKHLRYEYTIKDKEEGKALLSGNSQESKEEFLEELKNVKQELLKELMNTDTKDTKTLEISYCEVPPSPTPSRSHSTVSDDSGFMSSLSLSLQSLASSTLSLPTDSPRKPGTHADPPSEGCQEPATNAVSSATSSSSSSSTSIRTISQYYTPSRDHDGVRIPMTSPGCVTSSQSTTSSMTSCDDDRQNQAIILSFSPPSTPSIQLTSWNTPRMTLPETSGASSGSSMTSTLATARLTPDNVSSLSSGANRRARKPRVTFATDGLPTRRSSSSDDRARFRRLQRLERRVFCQSLRRWDARTRLHVLSNHALEGSTTEATQLLDNTYREHPPRTRSSNDLAGERSSDLQIHLASPFTGVNSLSASMRLEFPQRRLGHEENENR